MGHKIFVSYKYADNDVAPLDEINYYRRTTVRDYVDKLESYFDRTNNIYKGESDGEDLSYLNEDAIWDKLKDRIFDSSVTIVMISPNMKEPNRSDYSQWIPWEISFSLKETTRSDRTSHTNAILAIVLPDYFGSYEYYLTKEVCGTITHHTNILFNILKNNKFNLKFPHKEYCPHCNCNHYYGNCSYIEAVTWDNFIKAPSTYIEDAIERQKNINDYYIYKDV